jgi:hypothetical protein
MIQIFLILTDSVVCNFNLIGYAVYSTYRHRFFAITNDQLARDGLAIDGLLRESVEQQAALSGGSSIEAKRELIEVVSEMRRPYCALMNTKPPTPTRKRSSEHGALVHGRDHHLRRYSSRGVGTPSFRFVITPPAIRVHLRSVFNMVQDKIMQACRRYILYHRHPDSARTTATNFCCNRYYRLALGTSTTPARTDTTDVGLIHFRHTRELVPSWPHHGVAQFMKPRPCRVVTARPKYPLQPKSARAVFWLVTNHMARNQVRRDLCVP